MTALDDLIKELDNEPWWMKLYRKISFKIWAMRCYLFNKRNKQKPQ